MHRNFVDPVLNPISMIPRLHEDSSLKRDVLVASKFRSTFAKGRKNIAIKLRNMRLTGEFRGSCEFITRSKLDYSRSEEKSEKKKAFTWTAPHKNWISE